MAEYVLEVRKVSKGYKGRRGEFFGFGRREDARVDALKAVSFGVSEGRIVGVLGANGAGKTTLLRVLGDLLEPDSGEVFLEGRAYRSWGALVRGRVGYVSSDERSMFWRLTGRENLEFFGRLYGMGRAAIRRRMVELLGYFELEGMSGRLFREYSAGTRKKFVLMRGLLAEPAVLLLDELTNSLDGESCLRVRGLVREYVRARAGRAALWSTHRLEEVSGMCDEVIGLEAGRVTRRDAIFRQNERCERAGAACGEGVRCGDVE